MQDTDGDIRTTDPNEALISDFATTKRQSRSLYRNWAAISKKSTGNSVLSQAHVLTKISTSTIGCDVVEGNRASSSTLLENRVDEIVRHIEQTHSLMDDNPKSNNDRIETLRGMTEHLTLKRSVKEKLTKSMVHPKKTLSFSQRLKYSMSLFFFKIPVAIRHFTSSFELWYSSLKVIEGHFGSNVASYFKFLRKLFLLNTCIFILMLLFVMIPQLLFRLFQYVDDNQILDPTSNFTSTLNQSHSAFVDDLAESSPLVMVKANPYEENGEFRLGNIFTGEGFLTNTILFYGYYTNTSLQLIKGLNYSIPAAYFFTSAVCYSTIFFFLFIRTVRKSILFGLPPLCVTFFVMWGWSAYYRNDAANVAVSYRKCYIEASGGMHNTFTNKVLCGWDFGIATSQAAKLKSSSIFIEIKELLDDLSKPTKKKTCVSTFYTTAISFSLNALLALFLGLGGMYSWKYLDQQMSKADTATTMMMWLILTLVIALAPVLFSLIAHFEGFESPSTALYMTLIRTFSLYAIVIAVVVAYRLNRSAESECWETVIGQDMFRLVVLDFIFGSIGTALSEFIRYRISIKMWPGIGCPEFDIARSTMNLIYNQTLFYVGLFFSPVLSLLVTVKLFIIFYIKKWGAIHNCKSFAKPWKASQAHTVYLSIAFLAFFCVIIAFGYIITSVKTSNCGPFRGEKYMYERLLEEILANKNYTILTALYYISRPGVVRIVLMAMLLGVYYMRAVALARIHVVKHLRHVLRLKAEDRKLLLSEIDKCMKSQDPPDDASCGGSHEDRSSGCEVPDSAENSPKVEKKQDELFKKDQTERAKLVFSSMTNLQNENGTYRRDRNNLFISMQNINSYGDRVVDELSSTYRVRQARKSGNCKQISFDDCRASESTAELEDALSEGHYSGLPPKIPDSITQAEISEEDHSIPFGNSSGLNFNPVFTESIPLKCGEEFFDGLSATTSSKLNDRACSSFEEEKPLTEEKEILSSEVKYPKNVLRDEDRVPSRISFNHIRKTSSQKKNH